MKNIPDRSWMFIERGPRIKGLQANSSTGRLFYSSGFVPCYDNWTAHDENLWPHDEKRMLAERAASLWYDIGVESSRSLLTENNSYCEIIFDVAGSNILPQDELPNLEAKKFFDMLKMVETLHRHMLAREVLFLCPLLVSRLHHRSSCSAISYSATPSPTPPIAQDPPTTS
ncbi:hypothetical protein M9H77_16836 [Catharanthus roseus]|uniref:Uncharacterized protein n=1 Tax=Catharanthus roseus TaxID=4058 RepID=A0ACC0B395_CATRO|nr:hypothetical protein M9H77_16836 [Catharanthus roseus]